MSNGFHTVIRNDMVLQADSRAEKGAMSREEIFEQWNQLVPWISDELMGDGCEGCVLRPLSRVHGAVELVRYSCKSDTYTHRKVAAALAGYLEHPAPDLLKELLSAERARDAALPSDALERLYCQSVVEDIVFSAARWCRNTHFRLPAFNVLSEIVEATIAGEYWNTASYAMATLCFYNEQGSPQLLKRFQAFCAPRMPFLGKANHSNHPSRPTLEQERQFAKGLTERNSATLQSIEKLLDEKDQSATRVAMSADNEKWLREFIQRVAEI